MNCASRLAELLRGWDVPPNTYPFDARGGEGSDAGLTTWRRISDAVYLVGEVDRSLAGLRAQGEDVAVWENQLPEWYAAVYSRDAQWRAAGANRRPTLSRESIGLLLTLGRYLDRVTPEKHLAQSDREALMALFDEAMGLLNEADEIPEAQRVQLFGLVEAARRTLGSLDVVGTDQLRAQVAEIALSMATVSDTLADKPGGNRLRELAAALWSRFDLAATAAGTAALTTGATNVVSMLTQSHGGS